MKRSILSGFLALTIGPMAACTGHVGDGGPSSGAGGSIAGTAGAGGPSPGTGGYVGAGGGGGARPPGTGGTIVVTGAGGGGGVIVNVGVGGSNTGLGGGVIGTGGAVGPFEPAGSFSSVRKVKNLLVGLAPTDADVATVTTSGAAGLQSLINTWMTDAAYSANFKGKMITFFRNTFQQTGFSPGDDFKPQLLENGGFDFGPLGTGAVGDDAYFRLVQNIQDSFALTAWQTVVEGRPFTDVVTTQRFMMTTALKSVYIQIEMPDDEPYAFGVSGTKLAWKVDMSGTPIALTDTLNPSSANYMVFDDETPTTAARFLLQPTCQGTAGQVNPYGGSEASTGGYAQLFQRLIGYTPRWQFLATPQCWEHPSKPYFTTADLTDWQWVTVTPQATGQAYIQPYDIPTLRTTTTLALKLPRVGYYTTPAFLALWNTNDSNQHRVTANQTLLVAYGQSFTSANTITPLNTNGLDPTHAVTGTDCYGCHKSLDPLRQFWATQLDFNDRNDFPTRGNFNGGAANPRPTTIGGVLAFGSVNAAGANMLALGPLLLQQQDTTDPNQTINRFAISIAQKLCYFANSAPCVESDPEFRRIAFDFQNGNYNFYTLVQELFSSPLVTNAADTATADQNGTTISITRRDHICAALSNRLGITDACALAAPIPTSTQATTLKIVSSVASDAFSRGSEIPVTPPDPNLFYRAASELLCENIAPMVVDATGTSLYTSTSTTNVSNAISAMVQNIIGYPSTDPHNAMAVSILQAHYTAAMTTGKATASNALKSTFALACQSPTFLSLGI